MDQADAQFHFVLNQSPNNIPALLGKNFMIIYVKTLDSPVMFRFYISSCKYRSELLVMKAQAHLCLAKVYKIFWKINSGSAYR